MLLIEISSKYYDNTMVFCKCHTNKIPVLNLGTWLFNITIFSQHTKITMVSQACSDILPWYYYAIDLNTLPSTTMVFCICSMVLPWYSISKSSHYIQKEQWYYRVFSDMALLWY